MAGEQDASDLGPEQARDEAGHCSSAGVTPFLPPTPPHCRPERRLIGRSVGGRSIDPDLANRGLSSRGR